MIDAALTRAYKAYEAVKNCPACAARRKRLKATLDKMLKTIGLTEDELVKKMETKKD